MTASELTERLLDAMEALMHSGDSAPTPLDRAMADAFIRGRGYLRFTETGSVEYVPYDEIHSTESIDERFA